MSSPFFSKVCSCPIKSMCLKKKCRDPTDSSTKKCLYFHCVLLCLERGYAKGRTKPMPSERTGWKSPLVPCKPVELDSDMSGFPHGPKCHVTVQNSFIIPYNASQSIEMKQTIIIFPYSKLGTNGTICGQKKLKRSWAAIAHLMGP